MRNPEATGVGYARRCRLRGPSALLTGRLFDEYGNRMSPTHANKGGAQAGNATEHIMDLSERGGTVMIRRLMFPSRTCSR
jgi:hypothetical protein